MERDLDRLRHTGCSFAIVDHHNTASALIINRQIFIKSEIRVKTVT